MTARKKSVWMIVLAVLLVIASFMVFQGQWLSLVKPFDYKLQAVRTHLTSTEHESEIDMVITNTYFLDILLDSVCYDIHLDSTLVGQGKVDLQNKLLKGETDTLMLSVHVDREVMAEKRERLEGDSTLLNITFNNYADLRLIGSTHFCLEHDQMIPPPAGPKVSVVKVEKINLGLKKAKLRLYYDFYNPSQNELRVKDIRGDINVYELFTGQSYKQEPVTLKANDHTYFSSVMDLDGVHLIKDGWKVLTKRNKMWNYILNVKMNVIKDDGTEMALGVTVENQMDL